MSLSDLFSNLLGTSRPSSRGRAHSRLPVSAQADRTALATETLEARSLPSALSIIIDYRYDTNNFFDTPEKRELFQSAADFYAARIVDDLAAIKPSGRNTWAAEFTNPGTGETTRHENLNVPRDTIIIFAGGRDLSDSMLGVGGPGGYYASGTHSWLDTVGYRGQAGAASSTPTDFGPWGGSISFDTEGTVWHFGATTEGLDAWEADFLSVAVHELGHIFGFGTSDAFDALIHDHSLDGQSSTAEYDQSGRPPLAPDDSHWAEGTLEGSHEAAMDPSILLGTRKLLTPLDWAALKDIGWTITSTADVTLPALSFSTAIPSFVRSGGRVSLDGMTTFENPGNLSLKGAKLVVSTLQNQSKFDVVTIGVGNGITKSGARLKYNGVVIGTYSNGRDGRSFELKFNAQATDEAVQACLRNLQFYTTSRQANVADRMLSARLINLGGLNTAPEIKTLRVL